MRAGGKSRSRRRIWLLGAGVGLSLALTGAMSLLFHGEIRHDMMITGLVCAVIIDWIISRVTSRHRRAIYKINASLESRVAERTRDLALANEALEREATERAALQQQLMTSERMVTAGTMAAGIAHEIRNPLLAIVCNLEIAGRIAREIPADRLGEELTESINDCKLGTDQVKEVVKDLASLANPTDDDIGPVDLGAVLSTARRLAAYRLQERTTVAVEAIDPPMVMGSAPRLVQVFLNLFTNAAQASSSGRCNRIVVTSESCADNLSIRVSDTGDGISPDVLQHVFDPFFTTKRGAGGTGLGLSICRSIVESCDGKLSIESTVGDGTTVTVALPLAEACVPALAKTAS